MDTWTLQMGYPVINVTRNYGSNTALVSQVFIFSSIILEYLHKNTNFKGTILAAREERIERYARLSLVGSPYLRNRRCTTSTVFRLAF